MNDEEQPPMDPEFELKEHKPEPFPKMEPIIPVLESNESEADAWIVDTNMPDSNEISIETRVKPAVIKSKVVDKRISTLFFEAGTNLIVSRNTDQLLKREVPKGKRFEVGITIRIVDI